MARKKLVVLGLLGPSLDAGVARNRWERWRPSIALFQHEALVIDRFELLHEKKFDDLANVVAGDIAHVSPETVVRQTQVSFGDAWDFEQVYGALHDFARSYTFNTDAEDYLVHITTGTHVAQICMFLLCEARYFPARLVQTSPPKRADGGASARGAAGSYALIDLDLSKYDRLASRFRKEQERGQSFLKSGIDTRNAAFNGLIEQVEHVALASRAPVLLTGPTGAGKSHLARKIFELKKTRRKVAGDFAEVNCATLRGDAAMSALFGHVKGAFTGAIGERAGLLRKADGGVLFLDEIGELGLDEQAMLLHAVEEKAFYPVGSDREVKSDFQLIAGTNRDLGASVAKGTFREDLLARINLWTYRLPGLRDRREDIAPNLDFEIAKATASLGVNVTMSKDARERFLTFANASSSTWSGNFRDLNAAVTRMATLATGGRITASVVDDETARLARAWAAITATSGGVGAASDSEGALASVMNEAARAELDRFDRVQLADVVAVCARARSLSDAGRELFAASRRKKASVNDADRLRKYLARFGLAFEELTASASSSR